MTRRHKLAKADLAKHAEGIFASIIGDWDLLARQHANGYVAANTLCGVLQSAPIEQTGALIAAARDDGSSEPEFLAGLMASIYNSLGRIQLLKGDTDRAREDFARSLSLALGQQKISEASIEARRVEQSRQLGILGVWSPRGSDSETGYQTFAALRELQRLVPGDETTTLALAERAMRRGEYRDAISKLQVTAGKLGPATPQSYYDRMKQAYAAQGSFPLASPEEEQISGSIDKHLALKAIHEILRPALYLEIGVQSGKSLSLALGPAIGIDPMPLISFPLNETARVFTMSSDEFFATEADSQLTNPPDLVFIDGMHLFEFVLRDFINVERYSGPSTRIIIDDIYPNHPSQAARERRTRAWTGDVWKLHSLLKESRPDLTLTAVDASPTGLLIISDLDPNNDTLCRTYKDVIRRSHDLDCVPDSTLRRSDVSVRDIEKLRGDVEALMKKTNN